MGYTVDEPEAAEPAFGPADYAAWPLMIRWMLRLLVVAASVLVAVAVACRLGMEPEPAAESLQRDGVRHGRLWRRPRASSRPRCRPGSISVADLRGPPSGIPDVKLTLVAQQASVRLASGKVVEAWTFNGRVPGPPIRARRGDLVEVTLVNRDIDDGVTAHWHGVDVPNAEDGVAGVTQDAVRPGARYRYRFRVDQEGSFWYHSHQVGSEQVRRGLCGPLTLLPRTPSSTRELDVPVVTHLFTGSFAIGADDTLQHRAVAPATTVRLRLVNTDDTPRRYVLAGTPFRVAAIDGTELNAPPPIENQTLELGGGARYDVTFTMPPTPVRLQVVDAPAGIVFSANGSGDVAATDSRVLFDPSSYGSPKATRLGSMARFDRRFRLVITRKPGFFDGRPGLQWAVNGEIYPRTPMFMVSTGDLVKMEIDNRTNSFHPMHLHGHHMLVLSRNGRPVRGSPWWVDTLNVRPKEQYEVAFLADNPGLWMDHCHNLQHAAKGLTMHVVYKGITTPFEAGEASGNHPE